MLVALRGSNVGISSRFDMRRGISRRHDIVIFVESLGRNRNIDVTTLKLLARSNTYNKTLKESLVVVFGIFQ